MAPFSRSPSIGMPGGSWTIEEEEAPQSSPVNNLVPVLIQESYTVTFEITVLDPANLSEEVRLLTSPTGSVTRVRISPECMEVLLPEQQQDASAAIPRHIRDSPDQRRSRYLHNIFPELADDLHAASRSPTDTRSVPSELGPDVEWEFPQREFLSSDPAGGPEGAPFANGTQDGQTVSTFDRGLGLHFSSEDPVEEQIAFATNVITDGDDVSSIHGVPHPDIIPSLGGLRASADDPVREDTPSELVSDATTTTGGGDPGVLEEARPSRDDPGTGVDPADEGADVSMSATHGLRILILEVAPMPDHGLSDFSDDGLVRAGNEPTSRNSPESQPDDDDLSGTSTTYSSHSVPVTCISIPSTARSLRSRSPSRSDAPSPPTGFGLDHSDDDHDSPRPSEIANAQLAQTPLAAVGDGHDSESLVSLFIRPATASVASAKSDSEAQDIDSEYAELEYHDEQPPMTPLSFLDSSGEISLPLSLDSSSFAVPIPNEWEVVAHPSSPDSFFGDTAGQAIDAPAPSTPPDMDEFATASRLPLEDAEDRSTSEATAEPSQRSQPTGTMDSAADIAGDENDDGVPAPAASTHSDDAHTSIELPPLDLHSSSFADAVLSSPLFHLSDLAQGNPTGDAAPSPDVSGVAKHARAFSAPNVERRSILWAPHSTRDDDAPLRRADSKGKGKARARTLSESGFAESEGSRRVEREVQTDMYSEAERLRARCARLEKKLEIERAKVAGLTRRDGESLERWEWGMAKMFTWGPGFAYVSDVEDVIL
ncbi:hypothetical protein C8R45DRAFT_565258 [Mycena sanguinolenta]|nr:hypothetical protein C8R45DRAFT_565258 [Mycena sanguinolenta]